MELLFVLLGIAILICVLSLWIVRHREMRWETKTLRREEDMGETFENLTEEELCDLMCGDPEEEDDNE